MEYQRFSEFAHHKDKRLDGIKVRMCDILDTEVLITGYKIRNSKFKTDGRHDTKYLSLEIEHDRKKYVVFTGSEVLIDQIGRYADKVPFLTTIVKIDRYYSLS